MCASTRSPASTGSTDIRPFLIDAPQVTVADHSQGIPLAMTQKPALGRARVPGPHLRQRSRQGRPFRRLGAAATVLPRTALRIQCGANGGMK